MKRQARPFNTWDAVKLVALLLMFIDHGGAFLWESQQWMRALGRGAAPIFFFLIGYAGSYRFRKDLLALAVLLAISDTMVAGHIATQNILFTLMLCRMFFRYLEKRGKPLQRPWEWMIGCIAMIASTFVFQYGSFGLLFAICGYMQRRPELYPQKMQRRFMWLSFIIYMGYIAAFSTLPKIDEPLMLATLAGTCFMLSRLTLRDIQLPQPLATPLKLASYYSLYIYTFHIMALEWYSGIPL